MNSDLTDELLKNYLALLARIDTHTERVGQTHKNQMACQKGCDSCCRHLSLFPVEAFAMARAFAALSRSEQTRVMDHIRVLGSRNDDTTCPLLLDRACMLYPARPVICRTHGFPLLLEKEGKTCVDFCPKNFQDTRSLPKEALLDLEQLNTLLAAINTHFLSLLDADLPERLSMAQALFLELE